MTYRYCHIQLYKHTFMYNKQWNLTKDTICHATLSIITFTTNTKTASVKKRIMLAKTPEQ